MSSVYVVVVALGVAASVIGALILATWSLSNKLSSIRSELLVEIGSLKTDLAVLKKSEEMRDEKINKMWAWWLTALERGWMAHMKGVEA